MKKQIIALATSLAFLAALTTAAVAASVTCSIENIDNNKVLLSCDKLSDKLKVGEKVIVKTKTKRKALEGC
jgi:hypothetical protein